MKMLSTRQFAEKHGVSASRIRQLLLEERIFPYQKLGGGQWILFSNSVIVPPYERPNRKLRGSILEPHPPETPATRKID